jgi:hypothetical protein
VKFEIISEGKTERDSLAKFLKSWLDPKLATPVRINVTNEEGFAKVLHKISAKAKAKLEAPGNEEIIGVIGLIDLYGPEYPRRLESVAERYTQTKEEIEQKVDNPRFRMHFAVHEVEAWLLSDKRIFPRAIQDLWSANMRPPEEVNFNEPPAKFEQALQTSDGKELQKDRQRQRTLRKAK